MALWRVCGIVPLVYLLSGHVKITFTNAGPQNAVLSAILFDATAKTAASYAGIDPTTQGHWSGVYGSQGYDVIGGNSSSPSYVNFSPGSASTYQWATSASDPRDLQTSPGASSLVAACAYSNASSFTMNLDFTDGNAHQVALYLLDYDNRGRAETIQISNAITGAVLDTESFSNFPGSQYARWNLSGDVKITISNAGGLNEVFSGLFIDPAVIPAATASFVKMDASTHGSYIGIYGSDGYDVFNSGASLPAYATLSIPSSVQNYTWDPNGTAFNALQDQPGSTSRIAACDYSNNAAFSFNLDLTDGKTHQVAMYVLDYDLRHRAETIQITDAITGKLLDSRNVDQFNAGKYLVWNLTGDVYLQVINTGGLNEVMSGVFFG